MVQVLVVEVSDLGLQSLRSWCAGQFAAAPAAADQAVETISTVTERAHDKLHVGVPRLQRGRDLNLVIWQR